MNLRSVYAPRRGSSALDVKITMSRTQYLSERALRSRTTRFRLPAHPLRISLFSALLACTTPALAQQADSEQADSTPSNVRWVADDLSTYVRSGPTDGYRIVGTLTSGQKVELIKTQGDYSQVRSESGDTVWIPSRELQDSPGPAEAVPQLQEQVNVLSGELATIEETWQTRVQGMEETLEARRTLIEELEQTRQALHEELVGTQAQLREAQAQLGEENKEVLMRYMVYGGGSAGAGLLVGLILPSLTRSRKRNDGWV